MVFKLRTPKEQLSVVTRRYKDVVILDPLLHRSGNRWSYDGSRLQCKKCKNEWLITSRAKFVCWKCARKKQSASYRSKYSHKEYIDRVSRIRPELKVIGKYKGKSSKIDHRFISCGHISSMAPSEVLLRPSACRICSFQRRTTDEFQTILDAKFPNLEVSSGEYKTRESVLLFYCSDCNSEWLRRASMLLGLKEGNGCPICSKKGKLVELGNKSVMVQGYEGLALDYLVRIRKIDPRRIQVESSKVTPLIKFKHKGRQKCHRPDIWIADKNLLIEVKSPATLGVVRSKFSNFVGSQKELYLEVRKKAQEAIRQGFRNELLLFNGVRRLVLPKDWYSKNFTEIKKLVVSQTLIKP